MQQVVWNLLSNAVKFTPKGGKVQVVLQRVNSHVEFSVSDTGIGIPAASCRTCSSGSRRRTARATAQYGGLGLGLAICKQLVELHGGSIRRRAAGEGQGATFVVRLPLLLVQEGPTDADRIHPTHPARATSRCSRISTAFEVLVVDDEADALELIGACSRIKAHASRSASAEEALA